MSGPALESRLLRLLEEALDVPAGERRAWVEAHTADEPDLRRRALRALALDAEGRVATGGALGDSVPPPPPGQVGAYRLTGLIGQGGMGAVYRGERVAGDFDHVVAVKLVRPGVLSDALRTRFRTERQTLAALDHPGIARLFDGGETADGQPWFVMELVDGRPLGRWLDEARPALAARLGLFVQVLDAVGHAHRMLVIHRDITPDNILVTGDGRPKLIDFGIAKPVAAADAGEGGSRSLEGLSLTPGFAAPERLTGAPATTLSDIYSLGVVFGRLTEGLRDRDLDAIRARAADPDPDRRYPSTDAFAGDVRAWLSRLPVSARAGGRRYVAGKFVRRHRAAVTAAVAGLVLLLAALAAATLSYARAERARQAEAARFAELRSLAGYMIFDLERQLARVVGNAEARSSLIARAQAYLSALAAEAGTEPALKAEAARGLLSLARVQGVPTHVNLGDRTQARANLARALVLAGDVEPATAAPLVADAHVMRALIEAHADLDLAAASASLDRAAGALRGGARTPDWYAARSHLRRAQLELATLDNRTDATPRLAALLAHEADGAPAGMRVREERELDRAIADYHRGQHGYITDALPEGLAALERADARLAALDAARPNDPATLNWRAWNAYLGYGTASGMEGAEADAARLLDVAERSVGRLLRIEPRDAAVQALAGNVLQARAQALAVEGRTEAALAAQQRAVRLNERLFDGDRRAPRVAKLAVAQLVLANIAAGAGRRDLACTATRRALRLADGLDRRGALVGVIARLRPGLADNARRCDGGGALVAVQ